MLRLSRATYLEILGHAYDGLPLEACGLLSGHAFDEAGPGARHGADVTAFHPCENAARSSKLYSIDGRDVLRADRAAEGAGAELVGVVHSHTHTDAYPSPTDVDQAPDPGWHYLIVSLRDQSPVVRSYRIVDGDITEEAVVVEAG
ncbi:MAG: Mov34/MPN/PAD-1 family protein [Acidimicrobiia bacterium]